MLQTSSRSDERHSCLGLPEPVRSWAGISTNYPRNKSVVQVFEETAAAHADKVALVSRTPSGTQRVTYNELNRRANRLAEELRKRGVAAETPVGLCVDESPELIVAILGILKAGGAYVPFDSTYPRERIDWMLEDTRTPLFVTQRALAVVVLGQNRVPALFMDDEFGRDAGNAPNPPVASSPTSLAYVMYTSGSTGRPKGVLVEHRSIVRLVCNTNYCRFGAEEVFLQSSPVSFDASTFEIWGALLHGSKLVLMPAHATSLDGLGQAIQENGVTTLWLTASLFNLMIDEQVESLRPLRQLLVGGESHSVRHMQRAHEMLPECTLIHGYGPTEVTTFITAHPMPPNEPLPDPIPVGRPIANTTVYILDEKLQPVAAGKEGEVFAGGDGVARGYLNNSELTEQKFLPDPFLELPGARMYRTGDRGHWLPEGTVEFLGRIDNQVKILGHRIEPGEIEVVLASHEGVNQVCVAMNVDQAGVKRLVAYYIPATGFGVPPETLKEFTASKLPTYMVPSFFVAVEAFPLNANGKIDRGRLPAPVISRGNALAEASWSDLEESITREWQSVLNLPSVGLDDNFFDLGGDSLLLVAAHARIQKALGIKFGVMELFEFATVRGLAKHLDSGVKSDQGFSAVQQQGQKQRQAFAQRRSAKGPGRS
jgi:amino acid adenylation domain-containing protein